MERFRLPTFYPVPPPIACVHLAARSILYGVCFLTEPPVPCQLCVVGKHGRLRCRGVPAHPCRDRRCFSPFHVQRGQRGCHHRKPLIHDLIGFIRVVALGGCVMTI